MLKMPVITGLGNVLPMPKKREVSFGNVPVAPIRKASVDTVKFGAAAPQSILEDPMLINFNVPVLPETAAQLNNGLLKIAEKKKEMGGSIKLLLNTPGGEIYSGLQSVQFIKRLGVPVDTIIMGGQAASMGSLLFMAGTGRRIMTPDSSLLIHQPRTQNIGGTLSELKQVVQDMDGLHKRMQRLFAEKTGLPLAKIEEITNSNLDFRVLPLKSLKMGFATHVLLEDGHAITKSSLQGLSDAEIDRRDEENDYKGLKTDPFDPQIFDPAILAQLQRQRRPGGGGPGFPFGGPGGNDMLGDAIKITAKKGEDEGLQTGPRFVLMA